MNFFENFGKKLKILEKKFQSRMQILTARGVYCGKKTTLCGSHSCVCVSGMEGGGQKPSEETSKSGSKTSMVEIRF